MLRSKLLDVSFAKKSLCCPRVGVRLLVCVDTETSFGREETCSREKTKTTTNLRTLHSRVRTYGCSIMIRLYIGMAWLLDYSTTPYFFKSTLYEYFTFTHTTHIRWTYPILDGREERHTILHRAWILEHTPVLIFNNVTSMYGGARSCNRAFRGRVRWRRQQRLGH